MMRRALLLDLDGTLVDSVPDLMGSINRMMGVRGLDAFSGAEITAMVGDGAAALVRRAMAARERAATPADLDAFMEDYLVHASAETRAYPGVPETLALLVGQGVRIGVCTNKPEAAARRILADLGLLDGISALAGGDTFAMRKPDPGHLLNLLHRMGLAATEAVMVGDHHNDVLAAQGAGMPCIFAAWGYGTLNMAQGAVAVAQSFAELPGLLSRLD